MKSVCVSGAAGFIGSHLVDLCLTNGYRVVGLDSLLTGRLSNLDQARQHPHFDWIEADLSQKGDWERTLAGSDIFFHLAGQADIVPSIEKPESYYHNNVTATLNVLQACRQNNVNKIVYAASSSCYGIPEHYPTPENADIQPQYPYALTKRMGEELILHWAQVFQMNATSLRLFNVYGPRSRTTSAYGAVFGVFLAQKLNGKPYTVVGDGEQSRDFTYVSDVASAFLCAGQSSKTGIFNIGSGGHYSINKLVGLLGGPKIHIPKRPGEPDQTFADISKIKTELGWSPTVPFEEGVAKMLEHIGLWKDAPVWDADSIAESTKAWFQHLGGGP